MKKKILFASIVVIALIAGIVPLMMRDNPEEMAPTAPQVNMPLIDNQPVKVVPYKGRIDELRRAEYYLQNIKSRQFNDPQKRELQQQNIGITERRIERLKTMTDEEWQQEQQN